MVQAVSDNNSVPYLIKYAIQWLIMEHGEFNKAQPHSIQYLVCLTFRVLSVTYVGMSCLFPACYGWHMSPYLVLSLCAIDDICHRSFISLNFMDLLSIEARISTQLFNDIMQREWGCECCHLNDVFTQKQTILLAIWVQIRSSMYLRWNCISFYQL